MIQIIAGQKGKGKTKYLIEKANSAIKDETGSIVYLDKNQKNMYELSNKIRLINVKDYPFHNSDGFLGFICGLLSCDHDLSQIYLDSFLTLANLVDKDITPILKKLEKISEHFNVRFILSISLDEEELPEIAKSRVVISL